MENNQANPGNEQSDEIVQNVADQRSSQDTVEDSQQGAAGEDEQAGDVDNSDISTAVDSGGGEERSAKEEDKEDQSKTSPEMSRQVRDNDDSEDEE